MRVALSPGRWQLGAPLLMKINADECWTGWDTGMSGREERLLSGLTGRRAWFALRCMTQPYVSACLFSFSVPPQKLLPPGGRWLVLGSELRPGQTRLRAKATCPQHSTLTTADFRPRGGFASLWSFSPSLFWSVIALSSDICRFCFKAVFAWEWCFFYVTSAFEYYGIF